MGSCCKFGSFSITGDLNRPRKLPTMILYSHVYLLFALLFALVVSDDPTGQPSGQPTVQPTSQPSMEPSRQPSAHPSRQPSGQPSAQPSWQPSSQPSRQPTRQPSSKPTRTGKPSLSPAALPTRFPTPLPTIIMYGSYNLYSQAISVTLANITSEDVTDTILYSVQFALAGILNIDIKSVSSPVTTAVTGLSLRRRLLSDGIQFSFTATVIALDNAAAYNNTYTILTTRGSDFMAFVNSKAIELKGGFADGVTPTYVASAVTVWGLSPTAQPTKFFVGHFYSFLDEYFGGHDSKVVIGVSGAAIIILLSLLFSWYRCQAAVRKYLCCCLCKPKPDSESGANKDDEAPQAAAEDDPAPADAEAEIRTPPPPPPPPKKSTKTPRTKPTAPTAPPAPAPEPSAIEMTASGILWAVTAPFSALSAPSSEQEPRLTKAEIQAAIDFKKAELKVLKQSLKKAPTRP